MNRAVAAALCWLALTAVFVGVACRPVNQPAEPGPARSGSPEGGPAGDSPQATSAASPATDATTAREMPPRQLSDDELADGWISLFDGRTLYGWQAASEADWRVEDEAIVVTSGEKGLLHTTAQFGDYLLRLDFRSEPDTNSGIFLHTPPAPEEPARDCYELNIAGPDNPYPTGSLVGRARAEGDFQSQDWQSYEVRVQGDTVAIRLNGEPILEYTDPQPLRRGHIGLQLNEGRVAFRNIRLRPLGLQPLFNGQDLSGWKTYPEMDSRFSVTEAGELHVAGGRGQLESVPQFADFVLQLQCKTHAAELNSGIFFRCISGEQMNGYECQIHNGFVDGDRSRPVDCGTGGFFRRQDARFVAADDLQWFHLTLVVGGPHMTAWVNGLQVSDWTDQRPPDDNPRRGLRLAPGTIMIQGHDPTTDISFRELHAAELPQRAQTAEAAGRPSSD